MHAHMNASTHIHTHAHMQDIDLASPEESRQSPGFTDAERVTLDTQAYVHAYAHAYTYA